MGAMRFALWVLLFLAAVPAASAQAATSVRLERSSAVIVGDGGPNRISVSFDPRGFLVEDPAGVAVGRGCTADGPGRARCPRVNEPPVCEDDVCSRLVSSVDVYGEAGDDDLRVGYGASAEFAGSRVSVFGGAGNDFLGGTRGADSELAGGPGDDVIDGAGSDDKLSGGGGRDRLYGGPGQDTLTDGDGPAPPPSRRIAPVDGDVLDGGPCPEPVCAPAGPLEEGDAEDSVDYATRERPVRIALRSEGPVQGQEGEGDVVRGVENVDGGHADDHLGLGALPGRVLGGDGDDVIDAVGDGASFVGCDYGRFGDEGGFDTVAADPGDDLSGCPTRCPALAGCPRPRLTVAGLPPFEDCARRSFRATISVVGVPRIRSVRALITGVRLGSARGGRLRATIPVKPGSFGQRDLRVVVTRAGGSRVDLKLTFYTCAPPRRR